MNVRFGSPLRIAMACVLGLTFSYKALALPLDERPPSFDLPLRGGGHVSLNDYSGQLVLVQLWNSHCAACGQSLSWLSAVQARYAARGLRVLLIDSDAAATAPALPFPVALDPAQQVAHAYHLKRMPDSFLIGRNGKLLLEYDTFQRSDRPRLDALMQVAMYGRPQPQPWLHPRVPATAPAAQVAQLPQRHGQHPEAAFLAALPSPAAVRWSDQTSGDDASSELSSSR
jgi:peroxiredoxin